MSAGVVEDECGTRWDIGTVKLEEDVVCEDIGDPSGDEGAGASEVPL